MPDSPTPMTAAQMDAANQMLRALRAKVAADRASLEWPDDQGYEHWDALEKKAQRLTAAAIAAAEAAGIKE